MIGSFLFIVSVIRISNVNASHIPFLKSCRLLNSAPSGCSAQIQIRQRYSWRRSSAPCTNTTIAARSLIGDVSSAERYETRTIPLSISFSTGFVSSAWFADLVCDDYLCPGHILLEYISNRRSF
jgi:hypothetical protein